MVKGFCYIQFDQDLFLFSLSGLHRLDHFFSDGDIISCHFTFLKDELIRGHKLWNDFYDMKCDGLDEDFVIGAR